MRTYENILTQIKSTLRLSDTTDHDAMLKVKMNDTIKSLNIPDSLVLRNEIIDIKGGRMKLPEDFVELIGIRLPDCGNVTYFNQDYINDCNDCSDALPHIRAGQVVGGWFVFNSAIPSDATTAELAYRANNVDCEGFIVIHDDYANAIRWGVAMEFGNEYPEMYPERSVARWERFYLAAAAMLRGKQHVREFKRNREYVKTIMNSILSDRRSVFQLSGLARRNTHYTELNSSS